MGGLVVCVLGLLFGLMTFTQLKNLPVHASMLEISELIYETCKTYLITQGKFILILEVVHRRRSSCSTSACSQHFEPFRVVIILLFSLIGIAGSYGVAWFGIRVNTFANSRTAFASLRGQAVPDLRDSAARRHEHRHAADQRRAAAHARASCCSFPATTPAPCFIGFAIGESLGAAALRIAGGIFTKIADIGSDLMKIVFNIKEDDARNPGVIADCTGDNAGDSVGPSADGFETYGVTGVALISFILLAVHGPDGPGAAAGLDLRDAHHDDHRERRCRTSSTTRSRRRSYGNVDKMNFEAPLTSLVWLTSIVSVVAHLRRVVPADSGPRRRHAVVEAVDGHHLRHAGRRDHPRAGEGLHLDRVGARARKSSPRRAKAARR